MKSWSLAFRLARRELSGGVKGFRIFIACLALGVAALATVGSLASELLAALQRDGKALLGGEIELRLAQRDASAEELDWLHLNSSAFSTTLEMRAMARAQSGAGATEGTRRLVELKAVDAAYPLHGALVLSPALPADQVFAKTEGVWGAAVDPDLLEFLKLKLGDRIAVGEAIYELRAVLEREPDRTARAFTLGPRVLVAEASIADTLLIQPGSLYYRHYRLDLPPGQSAEEWRAFLNESWPEAGWRVRDLTEASPGLERFVQQTRLFMSLVGLTALLIGGIGVGNAVRAFLEGRRATIATLKCLGAPAALIFRIYLLQVGVLSLIGIAIGVAVGALAPLLAAPFLEARVNLSLNATPHPLALLQAAVMGLLIALLFALFPLARAKGLSGAALFRGALEVSLPSLPRRTWGLAALIALALAGLAIGGSDDPIFASYFLAAAVGALLLFRLAAFLAQRLARALPHARRPSLRLALANLHRPGSTTASVVVSFGLGLTVLVAVALIRASLAQQIEEELPAKAPSFYFLDIQKDQLGDFLALVKAHPGVGAVDEVPMLRGRIDRVKGIKVEDMTIPPEVAWIFQGDRGLTWAAERPSDSELTEGSWWPADYQGPPLVSLDAEVGTALGLKLGDQLSVNVLGRSFDVTIANFRLVKWQELKIAFVMIFSPGFLEAAPSTHIATVEVTDENYVDLERQVTDAFPNVSAIRVKDALASFSELLDKVVTAVAATGAIGVLAGLLVLAGAMVAEQRQRRYEAVILKVLGATRGAILRTFLLEYGALGLVTSLIAALLGSGAAWAVVTGVMESSFAFQPGPLFITLAAGVGVTLSFGFIGTWRALGQPAAPYLRNE